MLFMSVEIDSATFTSFELWNFKDLKNVAIFFNDNIDNDDDDDNNNDDHNILSIFFYLRVRWSKFEFAIAHVQFFFFLISLDEGTTS